MFLIDYITPEKAEGKIKEIYSMIPTGRPVPEPMQLYSASPRYLEKQMEILQTIMKDGEYEPELLAAMRYIGSINTCFGYCATYNKDILGSMGLSEEEIDALITDPYQAFEAKEASLLALISKAMTKPESVCSADINTAREHGWTDSQIFESTAYAAQMATLGIVVGAFSK
ncbi:carboxymuconolactone decarboxylase family protein [Pseudodesulfovibrio piezophilus]|uniref:Carboxymuconolactone decarboxylase-like domain-containing protein n=1 Tax=Pseudodesulfovibrio piezophilus (strain DSM 21447 / JCM 15486 / C1TLV30) TaxID=1322246 RepID=M1WUF7_PSEP2|nr:hypothetical protein [Pseudodesulfovibrio piezophilus]CCH47258.1 protein of unknown function [Pseudodesulfovibrio piezophilus C1TLV30]